MPKRIKTGDTLPPLVRSFILDRKSLDEESRTIDAVLSTETENVQRWFGVEILDHSRGAVRLDRMNNGAPLLMDHNPSDQRGVIEKGSAKLTGGEMRARLRFSKSDRGEELMRDVSDGIREKVSIGYAVHRMELEETGDDVPDKYRVTDWEPFEASSVSIPADDDAGMGRDDFEKLFNGEHRSADLKTTVTVETRSKQPTQNNAMTKEEKQRRAAIEEIAEELGISDGERDSAIKDGTNADDFRAAHSQTPDQPSPEGNAANNEGSAQRAEETDNGNVAQESGETRNVNVDPNATARAVRAEVDRRDEIRAIGERFNVDEKEITAAIRNGDMTVDAFKLRVFNAQESAQPMPQEKERSPVQPGSREFLEQEWTEQANGIIRAAGFTIPERPARRILTDDRASRREVISAPNIIVHRTLTGAVNLADVAVLDAGIGAPIIDEAVGESPEVAVFPVNTVAGGSVELSVRTGNPTVGFRNANEGRDYKRGTFESRLFQTMVIEEPIGIDIQGVLNASESPGRILEAESMAVLAAVLEHIGVQTWYGGSAQAEADAKAAPGLIQQYAADSAHEVDAGDSTAKSSVWFLRLGDNLCDHAYGNGTTLNFGQWRESTLTDSNNRKLRGLENFITGRVAPRLMNKNAAVRIKNCGTDTPALDDDVMYEAFRKFRENKAGQPNAIFMTPRSQEQLRQSRTATNETGEPAPLPLQWRGIPIYATNNLSEAETV